MTLKDEILCRAASEYWTATERDERMRHRSAALNPEDFAAVWGDAPWAIVCTDIAVRFTPDPSLMPGCYVLGMREGPNLRRESVIALACQMRAANGIRIDKDERRKIAEEYDWLTTALPQEGPS